MTPMISLRDIRKHYGDGDILRGVNMDVPSGQTVAIIGPSGSGKSTLLRLVMCLERPDSGTLEIDGESPWQRVNGGHISAASKAQLRRVRGKVGMVFQHFNLFPHMNVLHNITEAPVHVLGLNVEEAESRARDLLATVGLLDKADAFPGQLSGGQKQRVAIARALAMRPKVMLFDEVTSALDPELVSGILSLMQELASSRTMTLLIVTHHMEFARRCADRVIFFDEGVILEDAQPGQFFHAPQHPRAAQFLKALVG